MKRKMIFMITLLVVGSCSNTERLDPELDKLGRATGPVKSTQVTLTPASGSSPETHKIHQGKVLEAINVPRYTYLKIEPQGGGELWAAIPQTQMEVGRSVEVIESLVMKDFMSPSLKRQFPSIVFGVLNDGAQGNVGIPKKAGSDAGMPQKGLPPGHPPVGVQGEKKMK